MNGLSWLGVILVVVWAVLWLGLKMVSGMIHLLVLVGVALIIWGLVRRGANAVQSRM
jgi:hypothetical protein